jgi:hypothetical protein
MSNIIEKIVHVNPHELKIYREGVFWIAYEQSAYYFWEQKGYRATKKFVKTAGRDVVSVGFPQNAYTTFRNTTLDIPLEKDEANVKVFILGNAIDTDAFQAWKTGLALQEASLKKEKQVSSSVVLEESSPSENEILYTIRNFPLADKTPMECMLFLSETQKELKTKN